MKKIKPAAVVMSAIMLLTMLSSCSSGKKSKNVVKEDDPWYDSTRFQIKDDIKKNASLGTTSGLCSSDDKIFSLYCFSYDSWGSANTKLDTYDLEGNLLNRTDVSGADDYYISMLYSLSSDPEGKTIDAIVNLNSYTKPHIWAFVTIDTETGVVSNIKDVFEGEAKKLKKNDASVSGLVAIGDYTVAILDEGYTALDSNYILGLFKNGEFVTEFDFSTLSIRMFENGFSIDESTNTMYATVIENADLVSLEFDITNGSLKNKTSFADLDRSQVNVGEYTPTDNGELCKMDSFGNVMKLDINTMTPETIVDANWYTPYFYPVSNSDEYSVSSGVMSCNAERTILVDSEMKSYGSEEYIYNSYIRVLRKAEKNPNAGKEIIELALPPNSGVTAYLANSIYEFNKTDPEYIIRVWDKYNTGFVLGKTFGNVSEDDQEIYKMIQDLQGEEAPDLAVGIQKNYAMRDEIFMDLSDFLSPEVMNIQYGNIIDAARINGKLYFLPVTLEIEGLVTNTELIKDGAVGVTFEEYDKLIEDSMSGFSPYDYPGSDYYNKRDFLLSCIDTKSAIEGDAVEFGTEQFRTAVDYAKDNFEYDDVDSIPMEYLYDWSRYRGECYYTKMDDFLDYVHSCNKSKGEYTIIGTPSVDGRGPRFKAIETISVSATTDVVDGCKKFLNYLFSGSAYDNTECEFRQIVTNKLIMSKNIATLTAINNDAYDRYRALVESNVIRPSVGLDKYTGDKSATPEMRESFLKSLSTISTYYYEDNTIVQFALEELAPYYAGDRSLDDAIKYLNDRTYKYIREM